MQEIVKTESLTLAVDTSKNRIYFIAASPHLFWNPALVHAWEQAKHLVSTGFTLFVDASRLYHISRQWVELSVKLQKLLRPNGLARTAELLSERVAAQLRIAPASKNPNLQEEIFTNRQEAEAWLDGTQCA